jgi:hypothetical protein
MGFKQIRDYIPPFYHRFLPTFFEKEIPAEIFARCGNCPMTASDRKEMESELSRPFSPETKCCTFIPRLPNFFAGAVFTDKETKTGRDLLRIRIGRKQGIFPQGIYPDKKYRLLYEFGRKNGFGKSSLLKCPYFIQGEFNCSLWKYRESICSTWFCKYLGAETGRVFWYEMRDFFKLIQEKMVEHAIRELGLTVIPPYGDDEQLSVEDLDDLPMHRQEYQRRWQHWEGREEAFYIRCFEIISRKKVHDFNLIIGSEYRERMNSLEEKFHRMVSFPEILQVNPEYVLEEAIPDKYRLRLRSWIDRNDTVITYAFDVPKSVIDTFRGGKNTAYALNELSEKSGIQLGKDLIIALFQHGILTSGETG